MDPSTLESLLQGLLKSDRFFVEPLMEPLFWYLTGPCAASPRVGLQQRRRPAITRDTCG